MEQILQKLGNKSLVKSREVSRIWQTYIDQINYPWVRIVKIPTILNGGNKYLHLSAKHGQIVMFEEILDSEADKNLVNDNCYTPFLDLRRNTRNGFTPFLLDCISGNSRLLELIMKNFDELKIGLDEIATDLKTAFWFACCLGHTDIVGMAINKCEIMNIKLNNFDVCNRNVFHLACKYGNAEVVKILMDKSTELKLDLNVKTRGGCSAFHMACESGNTSIVKMILDQSDSANIDLRAKNRWSDTALIVFLQNLFLLSLNQHHRLRLSHLFLPLSPLRHQYHWGLRHCL